MDVSHRHKARLGKSVENADMKILGRVLFTGVNDYKAEIEKDEVLQNGGDANENVNWALNLSFLMRAETKLTEQRKKAEESIKKSDQIIERHRKEINM